ncbi:leucine dehydrogenase-like [Rhopilema esculentum]|uniref:leucine dehydrogenase-like n=1 Tax=Rhopilema esculentum TaxID=499914 RepID=UPI0031D91C87|eukprot:gene447-10119_t
MTSLVGSHTKYAVRNLRGLVGAAVTPLFTRHFHYTEVARTKNDFSSTVQAKTLLDMKPYEFVKHMKKNNVKRCFVVFDKASDSVLASNEIFSDLKTFCEKDKIDYKEHEGFFLEIGRRSGALLGAFVWRTNRGQACGGIRLWNYTRLEDYIRDGLRLAYGMGVKSALAGLWAGGGKGVIASPEYDISHPGIRKQMFLDYGDFLSSLNGCYVAAEDAGVVVSDVDNVHMRTRFTTCISEELGGSGNPSVATGKGIVCAMEAALDYLKMGTIDGKSVVLQGAGNVARVIIDGLLSRNVGRILATDCNEQQLQLTERMFAGRHNGLLELGLVPVNETETLAKECDILSPNALGNVLNEKTIPNIKAKIVCGAANNQLGKPDDNKLMADRGITYVVDFLCNRMGIVNCANEAYGRLPRDPAIERHFDKEYENSIWQMTHRVLRAADIKGVTPVEAATEIAETMSHELHPIWPNRSQEIIDSLVRSKWHESV